MKKLSILIMSIFLLSVIPVIAQEIATTEDIKSAGITPDQPIRWRIELMSNRITEIFSENARIEHAKERLAEAKVMMHRNKFQYAEKAMNRFEKSYTRTKNKAILIEDKELVDNLGQKIQGVAKGENLSQEKIQEIKQLTEQHRERIRERENGVCCKIYGLGSGMKKVNVRYQKMLSEECKVSENFVGGGREIVEGSLC